MDTITRIFDLVDKIYPEQQAFAAAIGVSPKTVSVWRTGRGKSYTKYLPQIAEALYTSVEYLLTGKQSSPPSEEDGLPPVWFNLNKNQKQAAVNYMNYLAANGEKL